VTDTARLSRPGLLNLSVVYVVWGSTYLAIRVAVRDGAGFPPFTLAFLRVLTASAVLLGWARLSGERIRLSRREIVLMAATGSLLWLGGNALVNLGERRASSGLAALLVAAMPIWAELIAIVVDRRLPRWKSAGSVLIGFAGVGLLCLPVLRDGTRSDVLSLAALLIAPLFWAIGSVWLQRSRPDLGVRAISGWQQLLAAGSLLVMALVTREPLPAPSGEAWLAFLYLVVFGSVIAFTAYMATIRVLPYRVVATYAYVNPVIAVFLGWLILDEAITAWTLTGAALVVAGVMGIFQNHA